MSTSKKGEEIDLHDSIILEIGIDPKSLTIIFSLNSIDSLSCVKTDVNVFNPIRRLSKLTIQYKKAIFNIKKDINPETILEFKSTKEKNGEIHIHIYTTADSTFDIFCENYDFKFMGDSVIDTNEILVFSNKGPGKSCEKKAIGDSK